MANLCKRRKKRADNGHWLAKIRAMFLFCHKAAPALKYVRFGILTSLIISIAAPVHAQNLPAITASNEFPAFAWSGQPQTPGAPRLTVSVVLVPKVNEPGFVGRMIRNYQRHGTNSDPFFIAYRGTEGSWTKQLDAIAQGAEEVPNLVARKLNLKMASADDLQNKICSRNRAPASEFTWEGVQRAGIWVTVTGTGIFSAMFYITSACPQATAASLLVAIMQTLIMRYRMKFWSYLNFGGRIFSSRVSEETHPKLHSAAHEIGKTHAAYLYNFISSSAFMLALTGGELSSVASPQGLRDTAIRAAFGVMSSTVWELLFARMIKNSTDPSVKKLASLLAYSKNLILMSISPLLFVPATETTAMVLMASFGGIGVGASIFQGRFINAASRVLHRMENSESVSRALTRVLNAQAKVKGLFKSIAFRKHPASCQEVMGTH